MSTLFSSLRTADIGGSGTELHSLRLIKANYRRRIAEAEKAVVLRARELFQAAATTAKRQRLWTT